MPKKIVILANNSGGLYDFRGMLMSELISRGDTVIALTPFDDKIDELKALGTELIETPINRRGINPAEDFKLLRNYKKLLRELKPDLVITYTIKPNVYGGFVCRMLKIPYAANITGLGTGATLVNDIRICDECLIGAGAVVIKNIDKNGTYVGVPARKIK